MIDQSAQAILSLLPNLPVLLPFIGVIDLSPFIASGIVFIVLSLLFYGFQRILLQRLKTLSIKTRVTIDDLVIEAIEGIRPWVYILISLYLTLQFFDLPEFVDTILTVGVLFAVVWQIVRILAIMIDFGVKRAVEKDEDQDGMVDPNAATASSMITLLAQIVLWVLGGLFILSNLGIEITSLIAGLGIGGIAVAFALQGILSDLFASFSIYFDKPFRIGDFIIVGQDMGTVERIGIKTTRIRTLQGEELVISNNELTTARVQNFKKMSERRIVFQFGITYETPHEKVKAVPSMVEEIFKHITGTRLDRVHFTTFGDSALIFEVVYFVQSPDYTEYLNIQQNINFDLMDGFAKVGINFAYPTQTVYVKREV